MRKKIKKLLRWTTWILLTVILLPVVSVVLMKMTGTMKLRKPDDQIMGQLHAFPIEKKMHSIVAAGREIVFLRTSATGSQKKNAVIFVHGSPGSMDAFLSYMHSDSLLNKADLIAYDRPGFGHSDFGKSLSSLTSQARVLRGLMDSLAYERYWLVGHSYGGAVIMQAAIDHPAQMAGMCIIAGSIVFEAEPVAAWRKWIDLPFIRPLLPLALKVSNDELMALRRDLRMVDDDWHEIRMPVSLIHGREDFLVPYDNLVLAEEKLTNADSVRTLVFEKDNHFILWTRSDEIIAEIVDLMEISEK